MSKEPRLTLEVGKQLIEAHWGGDFRKATAISCGVHPDVLKVWLRRGLADASDEPYATFALEFMRAEVELRQGKLTELLTCSSKVRASVLQWYMTRRFRDWSDKQPSGADSAKEALDELEHMGKGGMTQEQRYETVEKLINEPPPELQAILTAYVAEQLKREPVWLTELLTDTGWRRKGTK